MAETLGGVNLISTAQSRTFDGEINYVRRKRWGVAEPLGYTGRIRTEMGVDPLTHRLRRWLDAATYASVKTIADAGVAVAWVYTEGDMGITSQTVLVVEFSAKKNRAVRGTTRWDCELVLEEQP